MSTRVKWQHALVQHPMYMIIRDDPTCAERTPPWGEPTIERYVARLERSLARLETIDGLRLGFEWSALELDMLANDFPDVLDHMRKLAEAGKVTFYNGTYSQPHLQILSSESNILQFEIGREVYQSLNLPQVETYAHQEPSLHDQAPQLLRAAHIRYASIPGFITTLRWLGGIELLSTEHLDGLRFVHGHEFTAWLGLDGTTVPLYLSQPLQRPGDERVKEAQLDLLHRPPIRISIPDMVEISDQWLADHADEELVLLEDAFDERTQTVPIKGQVRLYTNWSYAEGIRAEELSRANYTAEAQLLGAEATRAIVSALTGGLTEDLKPEWRELLLWQHHDAYCFCSPGLKRQAIPRLEHLATRAAQRTESTIQSLAQSVRSTDQDGQPVLVVNTMPHPVRQLLRIPGGRGERILDSSGSEIAAGPALASEPGLEALIEMDGLGYRLLYVQGDRETTATATPTEHPVNFNNDYYRIQIEPDGTISSLQLRNDGIELIDRASGGGNFLTATDTAGLSPVGSDEANLDREPWIVPPPGEPLQWTTTAPTSLDQTALGVALTATGKLNDRATGEVRVRCYSNLPWISIEWRLTFDNATIGTFLDDESKLLTRWALAIDGELSHDIPFGAVTAEQDRPILPTSWVDYSDTTRGLTQFHFGTPKYWLTDNRLSNLVAWGEHTDAISNRIASRRWPKSFDQRLNGTHRIRYAIYPHSGNWQAANVPLIAQAVKSPLRAVPTSRHDGTLPAALTLLQLTEASVMTTAVRSMERGRLQCRVFETYGGQAALTTRTDRVELQDVESLDAEPITRLTPFQIANMRFRGPAADK